MLFYVKYLFEKIETVGMLFCKGVDVAHAFLLKNLVNSDEDSCFLYIAKFMIDGSAKYAHSGTESHVSVDKGRNVVAALAHFGVCLLYTSPSPRD